MTRSILTCFHKFTPYGGQFYQPIYDYFMANMKKYRDEFDRLYILDSNWGMEDIPEWATVIKVNSSLRYYDAYKAVLPQIKEDLVLLLDNDFVIYKKDVVGRAFRLLMDVIDLETDELVEKGKDVVSIYDTIGTYKTDKMDGKNKFCPYWFATRKELLMKCKDIEWGDHMPHSETLGLLTEAMLNDGVKPYEWEEDKSNIYFDGTKDGERSKHLGYYHIRAGSTPAVLLAWKFTAPDTYREYLKNQPKNEYLRQTAWMWWMCYETANTDVLNALSGLVTDVGVSEADWDRYMRKFVQYHKLGSRI